MTLSPHQLFVDRALALVQPDERFAGLAVGGSWCEGRLDAWSDLDLIFVCWPGHQDAILQERQTMAAKLGDLLVCSVSENESRLLLCLYDAPLLHVGLKFLNLQAFETRVEDPTVLFERNGALSEILQRTQGAYPAPDLQWVEDHFWIWMHYAILRLGRGEWLELADHLAYVRNQALGSLLLMRHGKPPRRVRRAEQDLPADAFAQLCRTVGHYDREALIAALMATIELYQALREYHATPALRTHSRAEVRVLAFLQEVLAAAGSSARH